jgi:hypothetical protein
MLLDDCLPEFDVRTSYAVRIAASPERVYASLRTADFDHWGLTRALYALRALPSFPMAPRKTWRRFREEILRQRFTLKDMLVGGFTLLEERPGEELVLGTVGRFWRSRGELCATSPARFREPAPAGTGHVQGHGRFKPPQIDVRRRPGIEVRMTEFVIGLTCARFVAPKRISRSASPDCQPSNVVSANPSCTPGSFTGGTASGQTIDDHVQLLETRESDSRA